MIELESRDSRVRRLQRLGHRALDQPASPDVAARGERQPGPVRRVARSAPPHARLGRDLRRIARRLRRGLGADRAARRGARCSRRSCCRCTRTRPSRALNARLLPWLVARAARRLGFRAPVLWGVRAAGRGADRRCSSPSSSSTTASTTSPPRRASTPASFVAAEQRFAARADLVIASSPPLAERHATALETRALLPRTWRTPALFATRSSPGRSTRRSLRCREPRIVFVGRDRRQEARPRAARRRSPRRDASGRSRSSGRSAWATLTPTSPSLGRAAEHPPARTLAATRTLPAVLRGAAVGLIPYRGQRADREHLPDEGLRVPRRGAPRGRDGATVPRSRRGRGPGGELSRRPRPFSIERACSTKRGAPRAERSRLADGHSLGCTRLDEIARPRIAEMSDLLVTSITPALGSGRGLRDLRRDRGPGRTGRVERPYMVFGADEPAPEYARLRTSTCSPLQASRGVRRGHRVRRGRGGEACRRTSHAGSRRSSSSAVTRLASGRRKGDRRRPGRAAAALLGVASRRAVDLQLAQHRVRSARVPVRGRRRSRLTRRPRDVRTAAPGTVLRRHGWRRAPTRRGARQLASGRVATRYVPNVVDVAAIAPLRPRPDQRACCSSGDFSYAPNREALAFLLDGVMPAVWSRVPAARLVLTGKSLDLAAGIDDRVDARASSTIWEPSTRASMSSSFRCCAAEALR